MSKNLNTTMKKLFYLLLALAVVACGNPTPSGPNWGPTQKPEPEPDLGEIVIKNIEPTTELGAVNESIAGLRFYPGISINIANKNFSSDLSSIASAGFKYIEITIKQTYGIIDKSDSDVKADFENKLHAVKANGLTIWSIHLPFDDANYTHIAGTENVRVQSVNNIMRVLRLCVESFPECKNYVLHASNGVLSPRSESVSQARKSLNTMIPEAKALGVRLCVENLVGSLCYSIEEMENTIGGINDAWVTYDIGHANCVGIDVVEFLKAIGPRLGTVHIHDTMFGTKNDSHSLIGEGNISKWQEVYRTMLKDNRYRGVFMFELTGKNPHTVMNSYKKIVSDYQALYEK